MLLVEIQNGTNRLKTISKFLVKLNIHLPYNSIILILGIYPGEMKIWIHAKTCTLMFTAALFVITETGNNTNVLQRVSGVFF